jgi:signal transduction histidine kinase
MESPSDDHQVMTAAALPPVPPSTDPGAGQPAPVASSDDRGKEAIESPTAQTPVVPTPPPAPTGPRTPRPRLVLPLPAPTLIGRILEQLPRPLDPVRSIKVKIGILMVACGATGLGYLWWQVGWIPPSTAVIAILLALGMSQILAHGMTSPLRAMTAAARAMARGDYSLRIRATSRDEVGELAMAFNHMAADLDRADQARRELIANVSHELRTPIFAVQAVLENVIDGVTDPRTLRIALSQTERLGRLVTELLDLSRIDAGAVPLRRETFAVTHLFDEVRREAEVTAAATDRKVALRMLIAAGAGEATADRERLHQVVANLVDNAIRHSPPGGQISLTARCAETALVVEVSDQGPGIPSELRSEVFERYRRGDRYPDGGTGLGLAICRWIVELHDGTITAVEPLAGTGCTMRIELPGAIGKVDNADRRSRQHAADRLQPAALQVPSQ